jgi:CRP-like cAMP-binding protein
MEQVELLSKVPLFSDLPVVELKRLTSTLRVVELGAGAVFFREGEPGDSLYIVIEGRVDVIMALDYPDEKVIASLGPGEFMGEMSLLLFRGQRTASVRSNCPARLWLLARADFDALLHRQPSLAYTMILP